MQADHDIAVVGGGLVGAALALGLLDAGQDVALLDEGDTALRASLGNFGLVWVQSKGDGLPAYARWTRRSADLWPGFAAELARRSGLDVAFRQPGGLHLCLGEAEWQARAGFVERMRDQMGAAGYDCRLLDRAETKAMLPGIGERVRGASYCPHDGHVDSLRLLRALLRAGGAAGLRRLPGERVGRVEPLASGFRLTQGARRITARRVVLAAGLGNATLAAGLGRRFPVRPQRGQILVTERVPRFLDHPTTTLRQTGEGTVMIGDSKEDVGFDRATTAAVTTALAARAVATFPRLAGVRLVRTWGALRVMSPDGFPLYQTWDDLPGLYAIGCHSGVTLAAVHAKVLAPAIASDRLPEETSEFSVGRCDVQDFAAA